MADNPFSVFDDEDGSLSAAPVTSSTSNPFDQFDAEDEQPVAAPAPAKAPSLTEEPSALPEIPGVSFQVEDPEIKGLLSELDARNKKESKDALDKARGDGFWAGVTDPQQYAETAKGVVPGAVRFVGSTAKGGAAIQTAPFMAYDKVLHNRLETMNRIDAGDRVRNMQDTHGVFYQNASEADRKVLRAELERQISEYKYTPVQERGLFKAGEQVTEFSKSILPPAPGYEDSIGRQLGEGLGSLVAGLPMGFLGRVPAATFFGTAGSGEALERAVDFDKREKSAGRAGLTEEQKVTAALWGVAPGTTDLLPVEFLLGRLKIPVPLQNTFARAIGKIGGQAFVEGFQEGGQAFLQNLIAREVYSPEQGLTEGIAPEAGLGAGVGGIAEAAKQVAGGVIRRFGGRRTPGEAPVAPSAEPAILEPVVPVAPPQTVEEAVERIDAERQVIIEEALTAPQEGVEAPVAQTAPEVVEGEVLPPAASSEDADAAFDEALRQSTQERFDEYLAIEEQLASIPEDQDPPADLINDMMDAEEALVESFRMAGLPGDSLETGPQPVNSAEDIKRAFERATDQEIEAYWLGRRVDALEAQATQIAQSPEFAATTQNVGGLSAPQARQVSQLIAERVPQILSERIPGIAAAVPQFEALAKDAGRIVERMAKQPAGLAQIASRELPKLVEKYNLTPETGVALMDMFRGASVRGGDPTIGNLLSDVAELASRPESLVERLQDVVAEAATPANLRQSFANLIDSKTPQSKWAESLGVSEEDLAPLVDEAVEKGWLRKDAAGKIRRAPKTARVGNIAAPAVVDAVPDTLPGEGAIAKTPAAEDKWTAIKATVLKVARRILPAQAYIDFADHIEIMRLRKEDELLSESFSRKPQGQQLVTAKTGVPQVRNVRDFKSAVDDLKSKLNITTRPRRSIDGGLFSLSKTLPQMVKELRQGSRLKLVADHVRGFKNDTQAIIDIAEQHVNIDVALLSAPEREAFLDSLSDLQQIVQNRLQAGYKVTEEIEEVDGILYDAFDRAIDDISNARDEAESLLDDMSDSIERIEEIIALLEEGGDRSAIAREEAEDATDTALPSIESMRAESERRIAPYLMPDYADALSILDVGVLEGQRLRAVVQSARRSMEELAKADTIGKTAVQLEDLQSDIGDAASPAEFARNQADQLETILLDKRDEASAQLDRIKEELVLPDVERMEDLADELDDRIAEIEDGQDNLYALRTGTDQTGVVDMKEAQRKLADKYHDEMMAFGARRQKVAARIRDLRKRRNRIWAAEEAARETGTASFQKPGMAEAIDAEIDSLVAQRKALQARQQEVYQRMIRAQGLGQTYALRTGTDQTASDALRISSRIDEITSEIARIQRLAVPKDEDKASLESLRSERKSLIAEWKALPEDARAANANDQMLALRAFHGSPHDFDRFSMSAIGTGEGAQAYGHGLYFAENETVANQYKIMLAGEIRLNGEPVLDDELRDLAMIKAAGQSVYGQTLDDIEGGYLDQIAQLEANPNAAPEQIESLRSYLDKVKAIRDGDVVSAGNLYEVELDVEPEDLLDWDKPLSQQSEKVKAALEKVDNHMYAAWKESGAWPHVKGETLYRQLADGLTRKAHAEGRHVDASQALREAGIPGIRYLDQGSRFDDAAGTRNIVIFDDNLVKITKKNGEPVSAQERADVLEDMHQASDERNDQMLALRSGQLLQTKIVGDDGQPLTVYHGTGSEYDVVDPSKTVEGGAFFATDRSIAKDYTFKGKSPRIVEAHLDIRNPKIIDANGEDFAEFTLGKSLDEDGDKFTNYGLRPSKDAAKFGDYKASYTFEVSTPNGRKLELIVGRKGDYRMQSGTEAFKYDILSKDGTVLRKDESYTLMGGKSEVDLDEFAARVKVTIANPFVEPSLARLFLRQIVDEAKAEGHDGLWLRNGKDMGREAHDQIVAFRADQIKPVSSNSDQMLALRRQPKFEAPVVGTVDEIPEALRVIRKEIADFDMAVGRRYASPDLPQRLAAIRKEDTDFRAALIGGLSDEDALARYASLKSQSEALFEEIRAVDAKVNEDIDRAAGLFALRGFYSPAIRAAEGISQQKGTGEQFLKQITKIPGVRKDEIEWMGLEEFLKDKPSITKAEVLDFMRAHQVELDEKVLGADPSLKVDRSELSVEKFRQLARMDEDEFPGDDVTKIERLSGGGENAFVVSSGDNDFVIFRGDGEAFQQTTNYDEAVHIATGILHGDNELSARFGRWKVPGGENYRELLIRLPELGEQKLTPAQQLRLEQIPAELEQIRSRMGEGDAPQREALRSQFRKLEAEKRDIEATPAQYTSKHFHDQEIVHLRVDDRTGPNGEKVLFVNEVQSDLLQTARKFGFGKEGVAKAKAKLDNPLQPEEQAQMEALGRRSNELEQQIARMMRDGTTVDNALLDEKHQVFMDLSALDTRINEASVAAQKYLDTFGEKGAPKVPFSNDSAVEIALKRALLYAAEGGYDAISWARSDQAAEAVGADPADLALQYDKNMGKFLDKYTKKWGGKVEEAESIVAPEKLQDYVDTGDGYLSKHFYKPMLELLPRPFNSDHYARLAFNEDALGEIPRSFDVLGAIREAGDPENVAKARELLDAYHKYLTPRPEPNPILRITPQMRASVMEGQPLALRGGQSTPQILTPEFKNWFKNSEVVDERGRPLVVYHGSHADITQFKRKKGAHLGFHFGDVEAANVRLDDTAEGRLDVKDIARANARSEELFKKLKDFEESLRRKDSQVPESELLAVLEKDGDVGPLFEKYRYKPTKSEQDKLDSLRAAYEASLLPIIKTGVGSNIGAFYLAAQKLLRLPDVGNWGSAAAVRKVLPWDSQSSTLRELAEEIQARGYDGIVYSNRVENLVMKTDSYIVFEPTQIKSAIGNRGTFDPSDPSIINALRQGQPEALGRTDPYNFIISLAMKAIEAEAASKGKTTEQEAIRVLRHEAVEFFKATGFFHPKEWQLLERTARQKGWIETTGVRDAYSSLYASGMSEAELNEVLTKEAIAEQYSEFHLGKKQFTPGIIRIFQRIKDYLRRIYNWMKGQGFQTWEDVFTRIDEGEFKRRFDEAFGKPDEAVQTGVAAIQATAGKLADSLARQASAGTDQPAMSLADIIERFNTALGLTVRQGRIDPGLARAASQAGMKVRGQASRDTGVIRLRVPNEIDTLAHEGGHALENRFKGDLEAIKQQFAGELTPLASPGPDSLSEGFAEWFRRYVTNPAASARTAPGFEAAFEEFLDAQDPAMLASLQEIRQGYQAWIAAPSGGAVASSIATTVPPGSTKEFVREFKEGGLRNTFHNWIDRIYTAVFDDLHPIRMTVDGLMQIANRNVKLPKGGVLGLKTANNPYRLLRLARDGYSAGHMDLLHGVHGYKNTTPQGPSFREALGTAFAGFDKSQWNEAISKDFGAYLTSRRMVQEWLRFQAGELSAPPDKFSLADHQQSIKDFEAKYPGFRQGAQQLYAFQNNMLRKKLDAGLITQDLYDMLSARQDYVPVMRDMSDRGGVEGRSSARKDKFSIISKFRGSQRDVINPLESIAKDAYETAMIIARNDAVRALDALARAAGPDGGKFAERIPAREMKATQVNVQEALKAAAKDAGVDPADMQIMLQAVDDQLGDNAIAQIWRAGDVTEKGEAIVYLWDKGERIPIRLADGQFGHDMLHAISGLNREATDWWINILSLPSTILRTGVTAAPDFIGANFIRDQLSAWVLTRDFVPFVDGAKGIYNDLTMKDVSRIYARAGGIMGGSNVAALHESRVKREVLQLRRKGIRFTLNPFTRDFWRMTEFSETGTRLAVFQRAFDRAKKDGLQDWEATVEAAYTARDYIDFGRRGSRMLAARRLIPFFNAALQGLDREVRGLRGRISEDRILQEAISPYIKSRTGQPLSLVERKNKGRAARVFAYTALLGVLGIAQSLLYKDDEEYEEISDYIKSTHWLFRFNGEWVRIPKPFTLATVSNFFERTFDYVYKNDKTAPEKFVSGLFEITVPPHSIPGVAVTTELLTDYSFFSGRPIVGNQLKSLPPELQFNAYASEFGKWFGKQVGVSPAYVDHFITGFGASYGREFVNASDRFMPALGRATDGLFGLPKGPVADPAIQDYFFVRRFTTDPSRGSNSVRQFWDYMSYENGEFIRAANGYKHLVDKVRDSLGAQEFLDGLDDEQRAYALLQMGNKDGRSKLRNLHPLNRAEEIVTITSGLKKEINLNRLYKDAGKKKDGEQIVLSPSDMRTTSDLLTDIQMRETRNALIALKVRGWEQRKPIETESVYAELEAAAPEVHEEMTRRLKGKKLPSYEDVVKGWPIAKERILEDGQKAILSDLYSRDVDVGRGERPPLQ